MEDYYQILGISPQATQFEVKRSFRRLAILYHPDKNKTADGEERFKEINQAYRTLNNPERRALYDLTISQGYVPPVVARPAHRDPVYRRRRTAPYGRRETQSNSRDLMAEYLPKFRWICYVSLAITLAIAMDYSLPFNNYDEDITEINRIYRTMRGGGMMYDHDELLTKGGTIIKLREEDVVYFKGAEKIRFEQTLIFNKLVTAAIPSGEYKIRVAAIYGNLFFIPLVLFISSLLGVTIRNNVEFPFNLAIVSFVLLIIVSFLLIN